VAFLSALARLPLREDRARDEGAVLRLAREHQLSVYSAVYLELARREGIPLATLDVRLQEAAIEANVVVLGTSAPDAIG
jgi:predicted nucleic acid-binding protein